MAGSAHPGFRPRWSSLAFRPYLLNSELEGKPPVPKVQHLERKLGKPLASMRSVAQLQELGRGYGLHYRFEPDDLASGTVDSHRLLSYVATSGGSDAAMAYRRELMRLYNEEGRALADREVLLSAVAKAGQDTDVAEAVLDGGAYALDVRWMDNEARKWGISMVPHYRFWTSRGMHSVSDYYEEWHFLDGIYRAFPHEGNWSNWKAASQATRAIVEALDAHKALQRAHRSAGKLTAEQLQEAADRAEGLKAEYRRTFLPAAVAGS